MAYKIKLPAIKINQPNLKEGQSIYSVAVRVEDLINESMFKVDYWKKENLGKAIQGYQRMVNERHATSLASYLDSDDSILPTAIVLSTRKFEPEFISGNLELDQFPVYIVDGQHRVEGLRTLLNRDGQGWKNATLPATLLSGFSKFEEMVQFVELNTKQKKVETNLALELMYDLSKDEKWRGAFVQNKSDWKVRSIKLVNELNQRADSVWHENIKMAGERSQKKSKIASANSISTSLKPLMTGTFDYNRDIDKNFDIINTFWSSLRAVFTDAFLAPQDYAIQKTPGLFSLHTLLQAILSKNGYQFGLEKHAMTKLLAKIMDHAEIDTDFWRSDKIDGVTQYGSMKGFRLLSDRFIEALNKIN